MKRLLTTATIALVALTGAAKTSEHPKPLAITYAITLHYHKYCPAQYKAEHDGLRRAVIRDTVFGIGPYLPDAFRYLNAANEETLQKLCNLYAIFYTTYVEKGTNK